MKKLIFLIIVFYGGAIKAQNPPDKKEVLQTMIKVNDYFVQQHADYTQPSYYNKMRPSNIWTRAVYYEGLLAFYQIYPKAEFYEYAHGWAEFHKWGLRGGNTNRNADDQCCGQVYIELYKMSPQSEKIRNIKTCMDMLVNTPQDDDWSWIDAIQMGMPILAQLGDIYKDNRYFDKMYRMYMYTRNSHGRNGLFNSQDGLWWRDAKFAPPYKEPNGRDCYWSRGNGWVYTALARVLTLLPEDEKHRKEYINDFIAMSEAIKKHQREDGFWNVSLHDPSNYGGKETSGTSLFVYGMAWGINQGILDRKEYLPVVIKAWEGMMNDAVQPNGFLGWVQGTADGPAGGQPLAVNKKPSFEDFGTGCFLMAASEMYKLK